MAARKSKVQVELKDQRFPEADNASRPEVGTQARFSLPKKPPQTYRYDSSLSPSLEWDGQNPVREEAEALIRQVLDALARAKAAEQPEERTADLATAQTAAEKLRRMSGPFLNWVGKAERQSFDVPTLPLFIHERLSTKAIIETLRAHRRAQQRTLFDLFADPQHAIVDQLRAYEHRDPWVNRLILGDNLAVMNSLIHLEKMAGQVQMIYMDPPYGVKFGSNFQPFVRKRDVTHGDDEDMTREPEMVQAFRDTWEVGLHSYLTCLRDRLRLARELLHPSGSIFVQISDDNLHHVREVMDEVFGPENFVSVIIFYKTTGQASTILPQTKDFLLWYARDRTQVKYRQLYVEKSLHDATLTAYDWLESPSGERRAMTQSDRRQLDQLIDQRWKVCALSALTSSGASARQEDEFTFAGTKWRPPLGAHWKTTLGGLEILKQRQRLEVKGRTLRYVRYFSDFPCYNLDDVWTDVAFGGFLSAEKLYVVQTPNRVVERCMLMTTDPGDLVLDPTAGSGTAAYVAEQLGRRWITIDVSRVPLALTRQRLLTATFPWYDLKDESRGPAGGFVYKRKQNRRGEEVGGIVPHVTLKSIANNEPPEEEVLVDRPEVVKDIVRVTGPFAVEAAIAPPAEMQAETSAPPAPNGDGNFPERMIEVLRRSPRLHLPGNRTVEFSAARVPTRTQWLSAEAALVNGEAKAVAIVFGPEHGAVNDRLVYNAAVEAHAKQYAALVVVGFAVEANARRMIDACQDVCGIPAVYVQATMDLMMGDLLKNMKSSQILSVCGSPEIAVRRLPAAKGETAKYQVSVLGLDVFNPVTMDVYHEEGGNVPAWFLCTDYNDRVFHITQAFFPRTGAWDNLKRALKGVYDDAVWEHLAGTTSAPFEAGENKQIAVKVIDDRGNELMVVRKLDEAEDAPPPPRKVVKEAAVQPAIAQNTRRRGRKP